MLRTLINNHLSRHINDQKSVAVLSSGGMDSLSVVLSCIDLGITPTLYTFYLKSFPSPDLHSSREISRIFNLPIREIEIDDSDINILIKDVHYIIQTYGVKKKTAIQCIHPFLYVAPVVQEDVVLTGLCADDLYGTSRSMAKHRSDWDTFQSLRMGRVTNPTASAYTYIKSVFEAAGKQFVAPYKNSQELIQYMTRQTYKEMNSPKQKTPAYIAYKEEIDRFELYRRNENLQCGSRIREWHDSLLTTHLNPNQAKTVVSVYNRIYNKIVTD